jgi:alginate O-acetyltransferase complex protein AlgI
VLVLIGWVLFYYEDLGSGLNHLGIMFGFRGSSLLDPVTVYYFKHYLAILCCAVLACLPWKVAVSKLPVTLRNTGAYLKPFAVTLIFLLALALIVGQSYNPFLYFRF